MILTSPDYSILLFCVSGLAAPFIQLLNKSHDCSGHCTSAELSAHDEFMKESLSEQIEESRKIRLAEIDANADRIVMGKLKTRDKKTKAKKTKKEVIPEASINVDDDHGKVTSQLSVILISLTLTIAVAFYNTHSTALVHCITQFFMWLSLYLYFHSSILLCK